MAACNTTFFPPSLPKPHKLSPLSPQIHHYSYKFFASHSISPSSVSSPETTTQQQQEEQSSDDGASLTGCKACGREEVERGCNGEGRIQGGIATVPGFGWWPIKAYRPCPAYVQSGGRYRRIGQSMDEVVSGGSARTKPSKKKEGSPKVKK